MKRKNWIEETLTATLAPTHLEVEDQSHQHAGNNSETHFRIVVVSRAFEGKMLIARHRMTQDPLKPAFREGLHALSLHTYTPEEWLKREQRAPASPDCKGGNKLS
ncbi:MAG TPA: BolA family transcriptional regulator [Halothiobacillaceae bacterium]|nr:BolA family transcriptional regulator [Halothiobacillaceae bacterium]